MNQPQGSAQYGPAPQAQGQSRASRGFFAGLFDFSFTTFVTTRIIKVLYGVYLALVVFMLLAGLSTGVLTILGGAINAEDSENLAIGVAIGLAQIVFTLLMTVAAVIYGRVLFECIAVFFRVAEHLAEINRKTKE